MARPRKKWAHSVGRYGSTTRIWEPRLGAPLRWAFRGPDGKLARPEVVPTIRVRATRNDPVDPVLERKAIELCEQKAASLTIGSLRETTKPEALTVGRAFALYFDPRRKALPPSREAQTHHKGSRQFWEHELGKDTLWDSIAPADVWGALLRLKESGKAPTAAKRFNNLTTLFRWLRDRMGFDTLRNPLRTLDKKALTAGHTPRQPRYTVEQIEKMVGLAHEFGQRFDLFVKLMADSGARAIQVREAMRSGLNCELEPPPPKGFAPHGWLLLPAKKHQDSMLIAFTKRQREAVIAALESYLAEFEEKYLAGELEDYPLLPGDRGGDQGARPLTLAPISDTALRQTWAKLQKRAEIPARARLAFHGSRRSWSDDIEESEGMDTLTAAGGWKRRETPEGIYVSKRKFHHIERARKHREKE